MWGCHYGLTFERKNMEEDICGVCRNSFPFEELYEYRGFVFCEPHFDEGQDRVNRKRAEVILVTEHSIASQRAGEFANNRRKYHTGNVASDGLPIITPKEPQILKD